MKNNKILIPEGWEKLKLKDLLEYEQPYKYSVETTNYIKNGTPVLTAGKTFILGYTSEINGIYNNLPVIIFDDFTTDSKFVDFPFKVKSSAMKFLKEKQDNKVDLKLIFEIVNKLKLNTLGGDHKRIWISDFSKKNIIIPKSISEQKKIAEILSKVDTAIEQTQSLIAKYRRIKTGLMQDLLTKGIDENGNIRNEKTHKFKDSELGRIPKEWEIDSLYNLCEVIVDCKHRTSPFIVQSIYPVIRTNNIKEGKLVWKDMKFTDGKSYKIWTDQAIPKAEDVIITREAPLGQVLKIPYNLTPILGQRTILFRTDKKKLIPDYLVFSVLIEKMQLYLNNISVGSTVHHLKVGEMKAIQLALPTNIDEQRRVLVKLNIQEKYISKLIFEKDKLQSIKTALMQDLLSGKKRVTNLIK